MAQPLPWWLRAIFLLVAAQALLLLAALFQPPLISLLVPWPASPLNARFIAAIYTALGLGVLLCSMARSFREVRIVLFGIGFATGLLFLLTLYRMIIYPGELTKFPLFWMLFYLIDPLLVAFSFWRLGGTDKVPSGPNPLMLLWVIQTAILGVFGLLLLFFPGVAINIWPWAMTVQLSQLYSGFFLSLSVVSAMAAREPRWEGVRVLAFIFATLAVLVLIISVVHIGRFKNDASTVVWFVFFAAEALVFGGLLISHLVRPSAKRAIS
jgi:hypothetical protein